MTAVLRVRGETLDLDACLEWIPEDALEVSWRPGDRTTPRSRPATDSGFNLLLSDDAESAPCQRAAAAQLKRLSKRLRTLTQAGASIDVDFTLQVGAEAPRSIQFDEALLSLIAELKVHLVVSAYPSSDE